MLLNLKEMRINNVEQKLIGFIRKYNSKLTFYDQTAINIAFINNIGILPIKFAIFNFFSFQKMTKYNNEQNNDYKFKDEELKEAFEHPYMIHYAGYYKKPWRRWTNIGKRENWWYYVKKSDYFDEIRKKYNFDSNEVDNIIGNFTPKHN